MAKSEGVFVNTITACWPTALLKENFIITYDFLGILRNWNYGFFYIFSEFIENLWIATSGIIKFHLFICILGKQKIWVQFHKELNQRDKKKAKQKNHKMK